MAETLPARAPAPRANLVAGGQVAALIPQSMEEAFRVSNAIAASGLAPKGLDRPEQVLVAIMAGAELGLAPFQSLQSLAIVNGRPTLYGDGLMAVVRAGGVRVKEWSEGEGDAMVAHCVATRPDSGEEIARTFSVADAKKAALWGKSGPWQQYPKRMLQMRARALALRDGCADMLRGIQIREEVEDYGTVRTVARQEGTGMRARLEARQAPTEGGFDPSHVEAELSEVTTADFTDHAEDLDQRPEDEHPAPADPEPQPEPEVTLAGADFDPVDWATTFNRSLDQMQSVDEVADAWDAAKNDGKLFKLRAANSGMAAALAQAVNDRVAEIKAGAGA